MKKTLLKFLAVTIEQRGIFSLGITSVSEAENTSINSETLREAEQIVNSSTDESDKKILIFRLRADCLCRIWILKFTLTKSDIVTIA